MIPDALDFILRPTNEEQAEYAAAHKTPAPAAEGEASAGAGQTCEGAHGTPNREAEVDTSALGNDDGKCREKQAPRCPSSSPLGSASTPRWSAVDDETADLLSLVAGDKSGPWADEEWHRFTQALESASDLDGRIDPNFLRPLLRGSVAPNRIGAFTNRAKAEGLIAWGGEWITSDDTEGRNSGKPARVYRWLGAAS